MTDNNTIDNQHLYETAGDAMQDAERHQYAP